MHPVLPPLPRPPLTEEEFYALYITRDRRGPLAWLRGLLRATPRRPAGSPLTQPAASRTDAPPPQPIKIRAAMRRPG